MDVLMGLGLFRVQGLGFAALLWSLSTTGKEESAMEHWDVLGILWKDYPQLMENHMENQMEHEMENTMI